MFSLILSILSAVSLVSAGYLIVRKAPVLSQIPPESLPTHETFLAHAGRVARKLFETLNPKTVKRHLLSAIARTLNGTRVFFLKMYRVSELMAKAAREKSQKMDWEHRWYSESGSSRGQEEQQEEEKQ